MAVVPRSLIIFQLIAHCVLQHTVFQKQQQKAIYLNVHYFSSTKQHFIIIIFLYCWLFFLEMDSYHL